jgi:hypothetical protein
MVILQIANQQVKIDAGELVSYQVSGHQFIHQKGSPGWRNSDTEMFPIIGPTNEAEFKVSTPRGEAIQDQHGLLREMDYELITQEETSALFQKKYSAKSRITNSKFPKKSTAEKLSWPYDFRFRKMYELKENGLQITFEVEGEEGMPFMLGYHPAFKVRTEAAIIRTESKSVTIPEVMAVGSRAMEIKNCRKILLDDEKTLEITTEGFKSFMLWTEVANMVCIEPITFYPYAVTQDNLHQGFQKLTKNKSIFKVQLSPK